ncbi:MAG: uncharacterized protein QOD63_3032 [Actinomycetota bacterium]|jgi:uncharacterized membrane protein YfcA|nr:uncharacterized protein [Actinomycetota bacterium]
MDPGPLRDLLTLALGVVTGFFSGAFGVGGAVISTPGVRLLGVSALGAVGTTLPAILPGAVSGTLRYAREGLVDWRVVAIVAPCGAVAAVLGSLGSHAVPGHGHWLMVLTAGCIGFTAIQLSRPGPDASPASPRAHHPAGVLVLLGLGAGAMSGLLGVGGGIILVPAFSQILGMPLTATVATSLACVGILAIPSTVTHAFLGDIDWRIALLLAVTVVPGARLGAAAALRAGDKRLRVAVAAFLGTVAVAYAIAEVLALVR